MSLRIFSAASLACLLAACGANTTPEPEGPDVECAIGPGAQLEAVCTLEVLTGGEFVIHHPDGGFRRFAYEDSSDIPVTPTDGAGPLENFRMSLPASGSDDATSTIEFGVENASYRFDPALISPTPDE